MAESIARPWLLKHLLQIAETRGANIHDAPPLKEKRKVQITRFLTFPANHQPNDIIWALVSDKQYEIPVKLTATAVAAYNSANDVFGAAEDERRLTARRFAIAVVGDVKAFFARVPLGHGKGMSVNESIALEIGEIRVLGSDHEGIFGNPANIETHEDIQEWISGLKEGGGAGNVLKRSKVESRAGTTSPARQQIISLPGKSNMVSRETSEQNTTPVSPLPSPRADDEPKTPADILKDYERAWKVINNNWYVAPPEDVQLQLDQILLFGQETRGKNCDVLDLALEEHSFHGAYNVDYGQTEAIFKRRPDSTKSTLITSDTNEAHEINVVRTPFHPLGCEKEISNSQIREPAQSTPSQWPDSEDEQRELKRRVREVDDDSTAARLPTRRCTRPGGVQPPECNEDVSEEGLENEMTDQSSDEEYEDNDGNESRSNRSDEEDVAQNSFPAPTPAQRCKQTSRPDPSLVRPRCHLSQPEASQSEASDMPSCLPIAVFPYHNSRDTGLLPGMQQSPQSEAQQEDLRPSHLQGDTRFSTQEKPESAPRILVPDSDTSGRMNSSQSQSRSQKQSQSQSHIGLQSQADSQPLPQTRPLPLQTNHSQTSNSSNDLSYPCFPSRVPRKEADSIIDATDQVKRLPLSQSRSVNQAPQILQLSESQANKKHKGARSSTPANEMTESRTQSETQPSHDDAAAASEPTAATLAEPTQHSAQQPSPAEVKKLAQCQIRDQSSSVTQDDSQGSRTYERPLNQFEECNPVARDLEEPETLVSLDADDARTRALVFGGHSDESESLTTKDQQITELSKGEDPSNQTSQHDASQPDTMHKHSSKHSIREAYRLSHLQESPSARLGKRPRSPSLSLQSESPAAVTKDNEAHHEQKRARVSTSAHAHGATVVKPVAHDSEAWKSPAFLKRREGEKEQVASVQSKNEHQRMPEAPADSGGNKRKDKQRADTVDEMLTSSSAGGMGAIETGEPQTQNRAGQGSGPLYDASSKGTTRTEGRTKAKKTNNRSHSIPSAPSTSGIKMEDVDTYSFERGLLNGFSSDLTLHNEAGGPQWLNWNDAMRILFNVRQRRRK